MAFRRVAAMVVLGAVMVANRLFAYDLDRP